MIISRKQAEMMYLRLDKLKSITKLGMDKKEWMNWCHTVNTINALETNDCIIGKSILDKFEIDNNLEHLILPYEITYDGSDRFSNLKSSEYVKYDAVDYGYDSSVSVMKPVDFNEVSDIVMAAFRKTSTTSNVQDLKEISSIQEYIPRMSYDGKVVDAVQRFVPVLFEVELRKPKFMNELTEDMFELWWVDVLRKLKGHKQGSAGSQD